MEETRKELWKPLLWNNEPTNYRVSTFGRIQNIKTKRYLKIHEQNNGYYGFTISVNNKAHSMKIAKVVALYFIPNDDPIHKTEVDHLGGTETKDDNSIYNLEWVTPDENKRRAKEKNLYKGHVGDQNPNALYSNEEISYLCELLENNEDSLEDLIKKTGVKADVIYDIYNGTRWKSISKYFNIKN